jgi:transcriptional regulator with XRE-family HTH domain
MSLDVGEKIKNLRIDKGLTQDELAERLNVSRALVCKWETGSRLPAYSNVEELSTIFDVDSELMM